MSGVVAGTFIIGALKKMVWCLWMLTLMHRRSLWVSYWLLLLDLIAIRREKEIKLKLNVRTMIITPSRYLFAGSLCI